MNKLITILAVLLTVNTYAASTKKAAKKALVVKPATAKTTTTATTTAPAVTSESVDTQATPDALSPQVNPQPEPKTNVTPETTASVSSASADEAAVTGTVDLRPSYVGDAAHVKTENYVDLGYKWGSNHLIFEQDFNTNLYNSNTSQTEGLNFEIRDALIRYKRASLWESDDKVYSLSYELRPYLPTVTSKRDAGMITVVRNYAKFAAKVSDSVTLSAWEIPIAHVYSRAGNTVDGASTANPAFENRVYLMADWNMTEKLSLSLPLMLNSTRTRDFDAVAAGWSHFVWTYPELDYALTSNYTLGLSWYNDRSFMAADLSGFDVSDGLKSGVTQLVFRATL